MATLNAKRLLHREPHPKTMEAVDNHCNTDTVHGNAPKGSGSYLRKDSAKPKSYRPISLLCHMYKLYEGLILNIIAPSVDRYLIKGQAGFRPVKSCCSQLLNLTQHIDDGYQRGMITSSAFVDLSAADDTVKDRLLIWKLYNFTEDSPLRRVIQNMLSSRRFYVELNDDRSRWRNQKNGLPQKCTISNTV